MQIRRLVVIRDIVFEEGGLPASTPVTRVAACAVIHNPLARCASEELDLLVGFGRELGEYLVAQAFEILPGPAISYGKGAIVGVDGEIEHAAAILHPRLGEPMRRTIGGGAAIIPSTAKVAAAGSPLDVPLGHKDDVWSFDHIETMTVAIPSAPRPDEIVVVVALSDGGRPRPRVSKDGAVRPMPR